MIHEVRTTPDEPSAVLSGPPQSNGERLAVRASANVERIRRGTRSAWVALVTEEEVAAAWRQNAADFERQRQEFAELQERWWQKWWRKRRGI